MIVLNWILDHWAFCAFILALFVEFTPIIKCNPITVLFKWIAKIIVKDVSERLDRIEAKVNSLEQSRDEDEKDRIRFEVLDFANSCRQGIKHTKDEFQHIIEINNKYEKLLQKTNDKNGVFAEEYRYIVNLYHKCQINNDFLS